MTTIASLHGTKSYEVEATDLHAAMVAVAAILPADREILNGSSTAYDGVFAVFTKAKRKEKS